uniref:Uncharacterized protein n=2 Tax=Fagus sylvatica TaxID=28930 RepID=A0A2N9FKM8_FAGSY
MNQLQMNSDHLPPSSHRFPASASESRSFEDSNPIPLSQGCLEIRIPVFRLGIGGFSDSLLRDLIYIE